MKRLLPLSLVLLLCYAFLRPAAAQKDTPVPPRPQITANAVKYASRLTAYENYVNQRMEKDKIPGLTIGFIRDNAVWIEGFGYADLENKVPATADSAYRLASVQKSMTAAAILQLVEQKKVDLDAEIQNYVPYFPKKKYPVTVRQLLGHLGGIRAYQGNETHIKEHKTTKQSLAIFADSDLLSEPGTKFSYTSYGYNILGAVIEGASKQSYADYMRAHIWQPLDMTTIRMDETRDVIPNRVHGYRLVGDKMEPSEPIDISSRFASGGTRATVGDLLKFMNGLNEGKVLSAQSLDTMYTPMKTRGGGISGFPKTAGYAMGWESVPQKSGMAYTHSGGQTETTTFILNVPDKHFCVALAMNRENCGVGFALAYRLYEIIMQEKWSSTGGL